MGQGTLVTAEADLLGRMTSPLHPIRPLAATWELPALLENP